MRSSKSRQRSLFQANKEQVELGVCVIHVVDYQVNENTRNDSAVCRMRIELSLWLKLKQKEDISPQKKVIFNQFDIDAFQISL